MESPAPVGRLAATPALDPRRWSALPLLAGLASGLSNTALQTGAALGVAISTTVAVSRSQDYLAANDGANPLVVLTEGY